MTLQPLESLVSVYKGVLQLSGSDATFSFEFVVAATHLG